MNSISEECQEMKIAYDKCFNNWIRDSFLKGKNDNPCEELFATYQACVKKGIKEKGIDTWELEGAILGTENEQVPPDTKS